MRDYSTILDLIGRVPWPEGPRSIRTATPNQLADFQKRTGLSMPEELREWLSVFNGARIGPGGLFGIRSDDSYCNIETLLDSYPEWTNNRWIPVAGDGCGNAYVLVSSSQSNPVCFVDASSDFRSLAFVVASDLPHFLDFLLNDELAESGWPFDRDYVLQNDPDIKRCRIAPMPWEA